MVTELKNNPVMEFHPDTLEYVRKELNLETQGRIDEALDLIDDWMKKQQHFVVKHRAREHLERTLITAKGSVERCKQRIEKLCTFKTIMPEMFPTDVSRKYFEKMEQYVCHAHLPKLTKEHYRLYLFSLKSDDFDTKDVCMYYRYLVVLSEYLCRYDYNTGFCVILDFRNINLLNFVSKCTPMDMRQMITLMTEGYGMRIKQIHIITPSKMVDALLSLLKQILTAKLAGRLHLHKNLDTLYDFVSKDVLPEEYGGKEKPLKELNDDWMKAITDPEFVEYFEEMMKAKTNESCRLANDFNERYVGMPGSFRALSVD